LGCRKWSARERERERESQINNLMMHLKPLGEKKEQINCQILRWKEIIKIRTEINEMKTK
jgi:hypothetical protein